VARVQDVIEQNDRFNSGALLESVPAAKNLRAEAVIDAGILDEAVKGAN